MRKRVVVLGAGATGEAFLAALRRLDGEVEITVVEHELVGGECSYWACIPSKTLLRPLEVLARARLAPGAAGALDNVDVAEVFRWRDEQAGKDDTSQAKWLAKQGAELVRGTAVVEEPGLVRVGDREVPYDDLMVSTGSRPAAPPVEGLEGLRHWSSREATGASEVPESLLVVGGGAVGCELAQFYGRVGSRVTLVQNGEHLLPRVD
ncbi:MAG: FAD-dependent oxidoreductase, partial [Gaiellaceae bacterium]